MESILSIGQMIASFLAILTVLVFVHEWGHYIVARINGVRVDVFSVGFGPEVWGFDDKNGTRWKVCWIPLGGYVKFYGDAGEASTPGEELTAMSEEQKKEAFHFKKLHQRAAIVFAGPAINFLFAILIIAGMFFTYGRYVVAPVVGDVMEGGAAKEAGILAGDRILSIDGEDVASFKDIQEHLVFKIKNDVSMVVLRDGETIKLEFTLGVVDDQDILGAPTKRKQIGIISNPDERERIEYGVFSALAQATIETKNITVRNLQGIGQIITGDRSVKELSGPITIARVAGKAAEYGIVSLINFMALISIGLGLINLFPIPMLDGGHLLYYAIEAVMRRKMSDAAQEIGFKIGLTIVLSLMVFSFVNDYSKI